uniref:NR LBD domain-containing protein n=1 Tax=Globodera pallida TaxID=36090 RepID=A0A183CH77_GLOPA
MDIIPFYYENGQLEAISSAHQWLKQSELSGTTCSIWSSGLNEAIARERFARSSTLAANGTASSNLALTNLAMGSGMPTGIIMPNHFLQQQQPQQQQQQHQIKNSLKSQLFNKINRRRKAAIIARCAVAYPCGVSGEEELLPPATSAAIANVALIGGGAFSGTTDGSDSDEQSDVEVLELDEVDLGGDDLFGLEERQHNDADPTVAQWRKSFEKAITERYRNKCRRRNMLCRRMLEFNLQRLKATEGIELNQLLLTDLQIREKYAVSTAPASDQLLLVHRETGRVFICLEDMFEYGTVRMSSKESANNGHGTSVAEQQQQQPGPSSTAAAVEEQQQQQTKNTTPARSADDNNKVTRISLLVCRICNSAKCVRHHSQHEFLSMNNNLKLLRYDAAMYTFNLVAGVGPFETGVSRSLNMPRGFREYVFGTISLNMRTTKKRFRDQGQHQMNKQHLQGEIFELQKLDRQIIFALMLDIDSLARKFLVEQYDHSLHRFAEIFMEMELSSIFLGRFSSSDLVEFSEILFIYCSRFMFAPLSNSNNSVGKGELSNLQSDGIVSSRDLNRNYKERIFGLFLCYSLYFLQPSQYVIPISVTASQLDGFYEFLGTVLMPEEHFEAIYCFYRLVDSNAFSVVPLEGSFNPLLQRSLNFFLHNKSSPEVCEVETDEFGLLFSLSNSDVLKVCGE